MTVICLYRQDVGLEDRNSEEGRTAVVSQNEYGRSSIIHLQNEVWLVNFPFHYLYTCVFICIKLSMLLSMPVCTCRCGSFPVEPMSINRLNFLRIRNRWPKLTVFSSFITCMVIALMDLKKKTTTQTLLYIFYNFFLHLRNGLGAAKEGEPQYVVVHCTGYIKSWPPAGKTDWGLTCLYHLLNLRHNLKLISFSYYS